MAAKRDAPELWEQQEGEKSQHYQKFCSTEICHTEPRDGNRRKEAFDAWQMLWE